MNELYNTFIVNGQKFEINFSWKQQVTLCELIQTKTYLMSHRELPNLVETTVQLDRLGTFYISHNLLNLADHFVSIN